MMMMPMVMNHESCYEYLPASAGEEEEEIEGGRVREKDGCRTRTTTGAGDVQQLLLPQLAPFPLFCSSGCGIQNRLPVPTTTTAGIMRVKTATVTAMWAFVSRSTSLSLSVSVCVCLCVVNRKCKLKSQNR